MGRRVYDQDGEFVWKYVFAAQSSEQSRIAFDLELGSVRGGADGDTLTLSKKDVQKLASMVRDKVKAICSFRREQRKLVEPGGFGIKIDVFDAFMNEWREKEPDILFWSMCLAYVRHARKMFRVHPNRRTARFYGEY